MVSMNPLNNCRGQVAVFYALLVPVFLFLGGVGLDLGWYYLNVSRLQNAADAAILAGANKLIETHTSSSENYKAKLVDKFPADKPETTISTTAGDDVAKDYAKKNLEDNSTAYAPPNLFSVAQAADNDPIKDGYTRGDNTVDMTTGLYQDGEDYYYVIGLSEDIHHFFIGFLDDMNAGVVAVALISKSISDDSGSDSDSGGVDKEDGRTLEFNANDHGTFNKSGTPKIDVDSELDSQDVEDSQKSLTINLPDGYAILPSTNTAGKSYVFDGWYTSPNPSDSDTNYLGRTLTKAELDDLFGDSKTVTLYAKYHIDDSDDNQQDVVEEGLSIFGAMKGRVDGDGNRISKGLEELMTYRTWMEIFNYLRGSDGTGYKQVILLQKQSNGTFKPVIEPNTKDDDAYYWADYVSTITPNVSGANMSYTSGKTYREETLTVTPLLYEAGKNNKILFNISNTQNLFLDLGSDLNYDYSTKGNGLFKYSWDSSTVREYKSTTQTTGSWWNQTTVTYSQAYNSIKAKANYDPAAYAGKDYSSLDKLVYRPSENSIKYRAHTNINLDSIWQVRTGSNLTTTDKYIAYYTGRGETVPTIPKSDPLYVRIESEELNEADYDRQHTTVRQMTINVNVDNTGANARPLIIFYEGPDRGLSENYDTAELAGNQSAKPKEAYQYLTARDPQPLVLNLNKDFKGILFAPNSPVIIKGNGHKMEGFVVAKEFVNDAGYNEYGDLTTSQLATTVKRRPVEGELPYNAKSFDEFRATYYNSFTAYKQKNFDEYEWVYDANAAFGLSSESHYAHFGITELERTVYTTLNPDQSKDMFFTTVRSKWIT